MIREVFMDMVELVMEVFRDSSRLLGMDELRVLAVIMGRGAQECFLLEKFER